MLLKRAISFSNLTLLVALALSSVAAYYSIIGLTAIFAGAVIPVIIMGSILEVGKITTTVWLRKYWHRAGWVIKLYLVPAVVALALLTSMGIFGFLSKAHMDSGLVSGDVQAKIAVYDEKIKTSKENIDANRKALKQLDEAVDQVMGRSSDEKGADKAVAIRRGQAKDRARLQSEITMEQKAIAGYNEERAPIAAEVRKVEAEVGPIKYIASLIYGDNPDSNTLEAAVRWVIILLVIVFDPLAIALVLAANQSKEWDKEELEHKPDAWVADVGEKPTEEEKKSPLPDEGPINQEVKEDIVVPKEPIKFVDFGEHPKDKDETTLVEVSLEDNLPESNVSILEKHPYLTTGFSHFKNLTPMVYKVDVPEIKEDDIVYADSTELLVSAKEEIVAEVPEIKDIITEGVTSVNPLTDLHDGYALYEGKHYNMQALKEIKPQLFAVPDQGTKVNTNFGTQFPAQASKGDIFVRVDALPNRVYKFDSKRWIEINKNNTDSYLHDQAYIKHLISKISSGEYDTELLSDNERAQIEEYLKNQTT